MRILIDVNHPAHVHLFRHAAKEWERRGHGVFWTARDKDLVVDLLRHYGFEFQVLSTYRRGYTHMAGELVLRDLRLLRLARSLRPDIMLGSSVNIAHVGRLLPAKSIFFTENDPDWIRLIALLAFPFADVIVMPDVLPDVWECKQVKHRSYHELAYLHPDRFKPDPGILRELKVMPGEPFFIIRLVAWGASHDIGQAGLSSECCRQLINTLEPHGRVLITSERELPTQFESYRIQIPPARIHEAIKYAKILIGDSATMAEEAAVLGTPAICCGTFVGRSSVLEELERKYGLLYGFLPSQSAELLLKVRHLLSEPDLCELWQEKRNAVLREKVDLTAWMVDFVERYSQGFCENRTERGCQEWTA